MKWNLKQAPTAHDHLFAILLYLLLILALSVVTRQAVLAFGVRVAGFFTSHVIYPLLITAKAWVCTQLLKFGSQVEPAQSIANRANLITNTGFGFVGHLGMKLAVGVQVHKVSSNSFVVTRGNEESIDLVLDLERNTTFIGDNHRNSCVKGL
ncbi:hypothetical protein HG530_000586 [Fusarium avenaceum]|nr:hypothetical protein HG530_000586 [Fusarium avenaceum]